MPDPTPTPGEQHMQLILDVIAGKRPASPAYDTDAGAASLIDLFKSMPANGMKRAPTADETKPARKAS